MNKPKIIKQGYVIITPTFCQGDVIAWSEEDSKGESIPIVFETEEAAWKEIADYMVTELQQFIDGERSLADTNFVTNEYVAPYEEYEDGRILVPDLNNIPIVDTTLEKWRGNR